MEKTIVLVVIKYNLFDSISLLSFIIIQSSVSRGAHEPKLEYHHFITPLISLRVRNFHSSWSYPGYSPSFLPSFIASILPSFQPFPMTHSHLTMTTSHYSNLVQKVQIIQLFSEDIDEIPLSFLCYLHLSLHLHKLSSLTLFLPQSFGFFLLILLELIFQHFSKVFLLPSFELSTFHENFPSSLTLRYSDLKFPWFFSSIFQFRGLIDQVPPWYLSILSIFPSFLPKQSQIHLTVTQTFSKDSKFFLKFVNRALNRFYC